MSETEEAAGSDSCDEDEGLYQIDRKSCSKRGRIEV